MGEIIEDRMTGSCGDAQWLVARRASLARPELVAVYASLFNKEDMGHDIVLPGAFRESLEMRGPAGIKLLFQHNPSEPIGVWEQLTEDARGLYVRGRLMLDVARAREVLSLMRAGALDGLSIGFRAIARPPRRQDRHPPPRESRPVGDLRRHLPAAARSAHRLRQGAPAHAR